MAEPEKWVPKVKVLDVFRVSIDTTDELKDLLGATSVNVGYLHRGREIVVEWTMFHRESFIANVGEYIIRNERGEFTVVDKSVLRRDYEPFVEKAVDADFDAVAQDLGRLLAVHNKDGAVSEALFQLPDGSMATFVRKDESEAFTPEIQEEVKEIVEPAAEESEAVSTVEEPETPEVVETKEKTPEETPQDNQRPIPGPPQGQKTRYDKQYQNNNHKENNRGNNR